MPLGNGKTSRKVFSKTFKKDHFLESDQLANLECSMLEIPSLYSAYAHEDSCIIELQPNLVRKHLEVSLIKYTEKLCHSQLAELKDISRDYIIENKKKVEKVKSAINGAMSSLISQKRMSKDFRKIQKIQDIFKNIGTNQESRQTNKESRFSMNKNQKLSAITDLPT